MLVGCVDQNFQIFAAVLVAGEYVAFVNATLHDVHRQALNKRSMLPSHTAKDATSGTLNRV